jgi:hypothetical protein
MAIVLDCILPKSRAVFYVFLWAKRLNVKDIHKEMFPVYGGKCLSRKAFHNWVEKHGKRFADDEEVEMEVRKWLKATQAITSQFRSISQNNSSLIISSLLECECPTDNLYLLMSLGI